MIFIAEVRAANERLHPGGCWLSLVARMRRRSG